MANSGSRYVVPYATAFDTTGIVTPGALLNFYISGTDTRKDTYTNIGLTIPNSNPVQANGAGLFPSIFLASAAYKVVLTTADGDEIWTADPVYGVGVASALEGFNFATTSDLLSAFGSGDILVDGTQAQTIGRTSENDGGGGLFYYNASDTTTADNGGTIRVDGAGRRWFFHGSGRAISVLLFGAVGDGTTDDTAAIQAAINVGLPIEFPLPGRTFKKSSPITYTGKVTIYGNNCVILDDGQGFTITDGSGSYIENLFFQPVTTPFTILRDPSVWTAIPAAVVQSYNGYMPTSQDTDIWAGLSPTIQNQLNVRPYQRPGLWFKSSSATANTNVKIVNVGGLVSSIVLEGYQYCTIQNCTITGNTGEGTLFFNNGIDYDTTGTLLGYTLARGLSNKVINCNASFGSYCGVAMVGNDFYSIENNSTYYNGESGIKPGVHDGTPQLPVGAASTSGVISGNKVYWNYYDGIDAGTVYGIAGLLSGNTSIVNNICMSNRATGITLEGTLYDSIVGNNVSQNGATGINATGNFMTITGNVVTDNCKFGPTGINNQWGAQQMWDFFIAGDGVVSTGNTINCSYVPYTYAYFHEGQVVNSGVPTPGEEGLDLGNIVQGISTKMYIYQTIPGVLGTRPTTINALNTWVTIQNPNAGLVSLRDNTSGGIALFTYDPLSGTASIINGVTGLATQVDGGGNFQIQLTSGVVPRSISSLSLLTV